MVCLNFIATFTDKIKGTVKFHQCTPDSTVVVDFLLKGFKPFSEHAIHIHEFGDLTDGCKSLGGHLNLHSKNHGSIYIDINDSHTGDLINNLKSDKDGNFFYRYRDSRLQMFGDTSNSILGTSVVIHDGIDDLGLGKGESKINGNAGGRIACAIIGKSKSGIVNNSIK